MNIEERKRDLEMLDMIVETMPRDKLEAWVREGCSRTGVNFTTAMLRIQFRAGIHLSPMNYLFAEECNLSRREMTVIRRVCGLSSAMEGCLGAVEEHEGGCTGGLTCSVHLLPDALIFGTVAPDWCVAMYAEADHRDYELMIAEAKRWRNWREVNKPSDGEALH